MVGLMVWGPVGARAGLWAPGFWSKARTQSLPNATKVAMTHLGGFPKIGDPHTVP